MTDKSPDSQRIGDSGFSIRTSQGVIRRLYLPLLHDWEKTSKPDGLFENVIRYEQIIIKMRLINAEIHATVGVCRKRKPNLTGEVGPTF